MWLEENIDKLVAQDAAALQYCITKCCQIKAMVVARDETEQGDRALLNLGHTFGHAIETFLGYGRWLHGEAISVGMLMAATLSLQLGKIDKEAVSRLEKLIARANLPTISPDTMQVSDYLPLMMRDKKVLAGKLRLILLNGIGQAYIAKEIHSDDIKKAIAHCSQTQ